MKNSQSAKTKTAQKPKQPPKIIAKSGIIDLPALTMPIKDVKYLRKDEVTNIYRLIDRDGKGIEISEIEYNEIKKILKEYYK